ncbi:glycoside hydrolase family 30 beta sandwich domain-containing protein [Rufibacter sediminis]|uniref:Glycoside hydrolase family 30 protein n=1 Tax=Rufibacter sediminis TaxID=2762756 RepID=A0ABR6VU79_9BACT|nr:glycoside hydrolase family 30 protein [Rufibacter sediminis]MBC3540768.1 glycoside hydrolase family 30 protein [Rufibacter sediminis]
MKKIHSLASFTLLAAGLAVSCSQIKTSQSKSSSNNFQVDNRSVTVYTTAKDTDLRLSQNGTLRFQDFGQPLETQVCVFVDPNKTFQTMVGIGGAITDATAETFARIPKDKQQEIMKAYYDPTNGIGYTLGRTTIHSSDFASGSYTYIEEGDKDLKTFSVKHDEQYRIPFIKQAITAAGGKLTMYVSPWSPPAFMKDTKTMLKGGKLLPEYRQNWANYYIKFINAYEQAGIPIWGLSVQNEPMAKQTWESCIFTGEEERDFIKEYLGPTLHKSGMKDKKLIAWDHNRDLIYQRASTVLNDPEAAKYVWGIGYHWYETWTGSDMLFDNLRKVKETFPETNLIFTEGCIEKFDFNRINDWSLGERYGYSMVNDFNAGTVAWTDWNMVLDEKGGPNHVGNFCFAPIHADTRTGKVHYTNSYYYLGHFSKFVKPGAKRIISSSNRDALQTTAFLNPDGKVAVIVLNTTDKPLDYKLWINGKAADAKSLPHSIATLVL